MTVRQNVVFADATNDAHSACVGQGDAHQLCYTLCWCVGPCCRPCQLLCAAPCTGCDREWRIPSHVAHLWPGEACDLPLSLQLLLLLLYDLASQFVVAVAQHLLQTGGSGGFCTPH